MSSTKELKRELGKRELFGIAVGQIIGAGIMALVGTGIGMTGRSVSFAFLLSAIWVILLSVPLIFIILAAALASFILIGFPKIQSGYFEQPGFTTSGLMGLLGASAFLTFSTLGANSIFQLSGEAKNPKKDIPLVLIVSTLTVGLLYAFVASVAAGVLPITDVANKNLTLVAKYIFNRPLYLFFIFGGALGAIASSLNATIAWVTKPIMQACEDGWFPKKLAYLHPKYKTPVYLIGVFYFITIVPIIFKLDINQVTNSVLLLRYLTMIATSLATMRLPKLFPEQWAKSPFRIKQPILNTFCIISTVVIVIQVYFNIRNLNIKVFAANIILLIICVTYALLRYKSKKVKMTVSYEDN